MQEYRIDVSQIEEWQMIENRAALDQVFKKAKETIVNGEDVWLMRRQAHGDLKKFDTITSLDDLEVYKKSVYKYL